MSAVKILDYDEWGRLCDGLTEAIGIVRHIGCFNGGAHEDEGSEDDLNCCVCASIRKAEAAYVEMQRHWNCKDDS